MYALPQSGHVNLYTSVAENLCLWVLRIKFIYMFDWKFIYCIFCRLLQTQRGCLIRKKSINLPSPPQDNISYQMEQATHILLISVSIF